MAEAKTPWGGRFSKPMDEFIVEFGASLPVDKRLWEEDIRGSAAWAKMLGDRGIITAEEAKKLVRGLAKVRSEIEAGEFVYDAADEDIHMAVERRLTEIVGAVGGKLHTGRSRNDQVALDTRMYVKRTALDLARALTALRGTLVRLAEEHLDVIMPGYTHMQRAQPVLLSHHLLAYYWMFSRDVGRMRSAFVSADVMPLGSAALAGTTFPIDRAALAAELAFGSMAENSMDAVSDRDFVLDLVYACSVTMMHLTRVCEELVLWSSQEFAFIAIDDAYATGSSIMPQKKNPDVAELVRGKSGRVFGDLTALLVVMKGLPLAYDKDMQEDKEAAFDAADTLQACVRAVDGMIGSMRVDAGRMRRAAEGGFMAATDLADYLAGKGVPFREAHEVVGKLVATLEASGRSLGELTMDDLKSASDDFDEDALGIVEVEQVIQRRQSAGGTNRDRVRQQLQAARKALAADDAAFEQAAGS
ncbi:MAG TPA: argininosuccinate lyase [Coriobacteriia bacterium]